MIPTPPLDIRYGPISWHMHAGWMVCDWCNTILSTAGMTTGHIKEHHLHEPELRRVWFPVSNRYQWICTACNDLRFVEPTVGSLQSAKFIVWQNEHLKACAAHGHGYHEPTVVLRHDLGIYCSTGTHGWMVWTEASTAMIGMGCATIWPERPFNDQCGGTWVAINRIVGYKDRNQWCRCGKPAHPQYDGEGIYYGHYCEPCWTMHEFDHIRQYKHDFLDAGEYLDEDDY